MFSYLAEAKTLRTQLALLAQLAHAHSALEEGVSGKGVLEKTSKKKSTNTAGQSHVINMINKFFE
jgi:hypothetical protein